jgi:VWFA-related protein
MYPRVSVRRATRRGAAVQFTLFAISVACLFVFLPSSAVTQTNQPTDPDEVLRVNTDLLLFPARVRDKNGQRPDGLSERDLQLQDRDGVTSRLYFSAGVDRVAMVFALDLSGSLRDMIGQQRDAAVGLYERFGTKSSIAVLHFDETPTVAAPFAHDASAARAAFDVAARPNHHTAIFDAAAKAIEMFDSLPPVRSERRIVVLLSDGLDSASHTKPKVVIDAAREKRVSFYVIHLAWYMPRYSGDIVGVQRRPSKGFIELGTQTGGFSIYPGEWAFNPKKPVDLSYIYRQIEDDLKSQYLVGFYLNEKARDGKLHHLSLSLPKGIEYQVGDRGYANAHKFVVH